MSVLTSEEDGRIYDLRFDFPSLTIITGMSGVGKSSLAIKLIKNKDILIKNGDKINNIVVFYNAYQPLYDELLSKFPSVKLINRPPTNEEFIEMTGPYADTGGSIVLIDDWMNHITEDFSEIATVSSRHNNCFTIMLFQAIFPPSKYARVISLNARYYHIFPDPRNVQSLSTLARQMLGSNVDFVVEAYKKVTAQPYKFFTIDFSQQTPQILRFRSNVLMEGGPMRSYVPNEFYMKPTGEKKKKRKTISGQRWGASGGRKFRQFLEYKKKK